MNKTRNYRERKQESISMNILHVIFDTKEMYEKAKTHFDSDGPSPFWAGDWNDETRTIEFAEANSVDTLEEALTADMESADIEGYHFELADTMELEPEEDENNCNSIMVLYAVDSTDNTKLEVCATSEGWNDGSKREAIDKAVRDFLGDVLTEYIEDPYEAHINDKSEEEKKAEFADTINKLASGQDSEFLWYELFWRSVPTL